MILVFIYGTLKRGFPLHDKGLSGARYLGSAQTLVPYPLFIARSFYGPVMLDRPGEGLLVLGEVYACNEARLALIDQLEGVGEPGSFRGMLKVGAPSAGGSIEAVAFFKDETWLDPLYSGYLSDYQDRRFIPPWER